MSYRPTAVSNEVVQGEPLRRADTNGGASGVRREDAWWWEAGPVSRCESLEYAVVPRVSIPA